MVDYGLADQAELFPIHFGFKANLFHYTAAIQIGSDNRELCVFSIEDFTDREFIPPVCGKQGFSQPKLHRT